MIKKWISLLTAGMLVLALAGCGSSTEPQQSANSSVPASGSLQGETTAVPEQSGEKAGNTEFATTIKEIPDSYKTAADQQGEVIRFDYFTSAEDKYLSYRVREGGVHDMPYVRMYLYNALPDMWP